MVSDETGTARDGDATARPKTGVGGHRRLSGGNTGEAAQLFNDLAVQDVVQLLDAAGDRPAVHDAVVIHDHDGYAAVGLNRAECQVAGRRGDRVQLRGPEAAEARDHVRAEPLAAREAR